MKMKGKIIKLLILAMAIILTLGATSSFAMQDYQGSNAISLTLSLFRYANGK